MALGVGKGVLTPSHPHTLSRGNIGALRLLIPRLPALCGVNDQKDDGFTALHLAALNNHLEASQALLLAVSQNYLLFYAQLSFCNMFTHSPNEWSATFSAYQGHYLCAHACIIFKEPHLSCLYFFYLFYIYTHLYMSSLFLLSPIFPKFLHSLTHSSHPHTHHTHTLTGCQSRHPEHKPSDSAPSRRGTSQHSNCSTPR